MLVRDVSLPQPSLPQGEPGCRAATGVRPGGLRSSRSPTGSPVTPEASDLADLRGLATAVAASLDLELHPVTLDEGAEAVHLDCRVVNEDVRPAIGGDEAVPLFRVEPLDRADSHGVLLEMSRTAPRGA